jgi:hypothetical protein
VKSSLKSLGVYGALAAVALIAIVSSPVRAFCQTSATRDFRLALPNHKGQLVWTASGFEVKQLSAKANGNEIGVRATNPDGITFLGFFFLFSEQAPMTSGKCLSGVMEPAKKENKKLKVESTTEFPSASGPTVDVTSYFVEGKPLHSVRAFVADQDICGDLEIYSDKPLSADSPEIKPILASYHLDREYAPQFKDAFLYAQLLYNQRMFKAAGPVYEVALSKLATASVPDAQTMRRMLTDVVWNLWRYREGSGDFRTGSCERS